MNKRQKWCLLLLTLTVLSGLAFVKFHYAKPSFSALHWTESIEPWDHLDMMEPEAVALMRQGMSWREAEAAVPQLPATHGPESAEIQFLDKLNKLYVSDAFLNKDMIKQIFNESYTTEYDNIDTGECKKGRRTKLIYDKFSIVFDDINIDCEHYNAQNNTLKQTGIKNNNNLCITGPDLISILGPMKISKDYFLDIEGFEYMSVMTKNKHYYSVSGRIHPSKDGKIIHANTKNYTGCFSVNLDYRNEVP